MTHDLRRRVRNVSTSTYNIVLLAKPLKTIFNHFDEIVFEGLTDGVDGFEKHGFAPQPVEQGVEGATVRSRSWVTGSF